MNKNQKNNTNDIVDSEISKYYFNENVQIAIIEYNRIENRIKKQKIFNNIIYPAIDKLVQNIINIYQMPYIQDTYWQLKTDVIGHVILKLQLYNKNKGKAFSYFTTIIKRYLINKNNKKYNQYKMFQSFDEFIFKHQNITCKKQSIIQMDYKKIILQLTQKLYLN